MLELTHVLAKDVGVMLGVFSDWPATVSYYASCPALFEKRAPLQSPPAP